MSTGLVLATAAGCAKFHMMRLVHRSSVLCRTGDSFSVIFELGDRSGSEKIGLRTMMQHLTVLWTSQ